MGSLASRTGCPAPCGFPWSARQPGPTNLPALREDLGAVIAASKPLVEPSYNQEEFFLLPAIHVKAARRG